MNEFMPSFDVKKISYCSTVRTKLDQYQEKTFFDEIFSAMIAKSCHTTNKQDTM